MTAFEIVQPCEVGEQPCLWWNQGMVRFACGVPVCARTDCKREGPSIPQGQGAALRAAMAWNARQP